LGWERTIAKKGIGEKGEGRREKGEGRREKGEGRREKGEGRRGGVSVFLFFAGAGGRRSLPGAIGRLRRFRE
jgi:hypothetical protein